MNWQDEPCCMPDFSSIDSVDKRLVAGLRRAGYSQARPVQAFVLPHASQGADILLRAPTGTGKTLAYIIPIVDQVLTRATASNGLTTADFLPGEATNSKINWRHRYEAVVLVPSRELVHQITAVLQQVCYPFNDVVRSVGLAECPGSIKELSDKLMISNILITNPGTLVKMRKLIAQALPAKPGMSHAYVFPNVRQLVLDEADLILSVYGYEDEMSLIFSPEKCEQETSWSRKYECVSVCRTDHLSSNKTQVMLVSATINQDLRTLRELALYKPHILCVAYPNEQLEDPESLMLDNKPESIGYLGAVRLTAEVSKKIDHRYICVKRSSSEDYLTLYGVIKGKHFNMNEECPKTLIFVNSPNQAAKCELVLRSLGVKVGRAIGTQSLQTRLEHIQRFNAGQLDVLVGMDSELLDETQAEVEESSKSKKRRKSDKASLLSRGLDYKQVARVILLHPASSLEDYTHKIGRCGRDLDLTTIPTAFSILDEAEVESSVWASIRDQFKPTTPDDFTLDSFVALRYRVEDMCRKASKNTIKKLLNADGS